MALPIEGFTLVAKLPRIAPLLESGLESPNGMELQDEHLWCCSFMVAADAQAFALQLAELGLNVSQRPDSEFVMVNEFDQTIDPYCEWLQLAPYEKAVIAWLAGTVPNEVFAREGWDPTVGSGLRFRDPDNDDNLELLRVEDNVEVYRDKETGEEVYVGRTAPPLEALYEAACKVIIEHWAPPLTEEAAAEIREALSQLELVVGEYPESWMAHWHRGKGYAVLGDLDGAYTAFHLANQLAPEEVMTIKELGGLCLELGHFEEAVSVAQSGVELAPDDPILLGNLAVSFLRAAELEKARRAIDVALKVDAEDEINVRLEARVREVETGQRPQPQSMAELSQPVQ